MLEGNLIKQNEMKESQQKYIVKILGKITKQKQSDKSNEYLTSIYFKISKSFFFY